MFEYLSILARSYVSTRFRNGLLSSHQLSKFPDLSACPRRTSFYSMSFSTATKTSSDSRHLCCSMSPNDLITWISTTRIHTKHSNFHNSLVIWLKTKLVREGLKKHETWKCCKYQYQDDLCMTLKITRRYLSARRVQKQSVFCEDSLENPYSIYFRMTISLSIYLSVYLSIYMYEYNT